LLIKDIVNRGTTVNFTKTFTLVNNPFKFILVFFKEKVMAHQGQLALICLFVPIKSETTWKISNKFGVAEFHRGHPAVFKRPAKQSVINPSNKTTFIFTDAW